jgi:hypothetical protein
MVGPSKIAYYHDQWPVSAYPNARRMMQWMGYYSCQVLSPVQANHLYNIMS